MRGNIRVNIRLNNLSNRFQNLRHSEAAKKRDPQRVDQNTHIYTRTHHNIQHTHICIPLESNLAQPILH